MDDSDARMRILISGLNDWVSLDEARHLVRRASRPGTSAADVRSTTLAVIADILRDDLMSAGDLADDFQPWSGSRGEIVARIESEWTSLDESEWLGIGWLSNTADGDALARPAWDALPEP